MDAAGIIELQLGLFELQQGYAADGQHPRAGDDPGRLAPDFFTLRLHNRRSLKSTLGQAQAERSEGEDGGGFGERKLYVRAHEGAAMLRVQFVSDLDVIGGEARGQAQTRKEMLQVQSGKIGEEMREIEILQDVRRRGQ
jgi:hypothetical protein